MADSIADGGLRSYPYGVLSLLQAYKDGRCNPREVVFHAASLAAAAGTPDWTSVASKPDLQAQLARLHSSDVKSLPLYGVPFAVKDNIDVLHFRTTAACPEYAYSPDNSAEVVKLLTAAGAIVIGKTNMDQFATGLVGTRSPFGTVPSVFDNESVGGGSSSGSAAVVSKGIVPFALATDTAGSGRAPAAFQNIVGMKPTPGLVSTQGVLPACRSLDCVSIMALTAADAALVLKVIESQVSQKPLLRGVSTSAGHNFARGRAQFPQTGLRVGVPREIVHHCEDRYKTAFSECCTLCETKLNANIIPLDFSVLHEVAALLYEGPWVAERYLAIGSFVEENANAVDKAVYGIVSAAKHLSAGDAFLGQYKLKELTLTASRIWEDVDVLMVPTTPRHPTLKEVADDPISRNSELGSYTNFVNLLGWAALSLPAELTNKGRKRMPFGITWIARAGYDSALLALGIEWQRLVTFDLPLGSPSVAVTLDKIIPFGVSEVHSMLPASEPTMPLAVVGAHLSGMPLHHQLVERGATLVSRSSTSSSYRLFALPGGKVPKPGLVRAVGNGCEIEVEVYLLPTSSLGSFLSLIPAPLGLGSVELSDGTWVNGFICEPWGIESAVDITDFRGWRNYMQTRVSR